MAAGTGSLAHQKARDNLFKAIEWAFNEMSETLRQQVNTDYTTATGGQFRWLVDKTYRGVATADKVAAAVTALLRAAPSLAFSMDRYVEIDAGQAGVFKEVLDRFGQYLGEIEHGTHDTVLDVVFPNPSLEEGAQADTRAEVKETLRRAYAVVRGWYNSPADRAAKIRIDTTLDVQRAGGLSKQTGLELPAKYFDRNGAQSADKKLAVLVHESTHAIPDNRYVTTDDGGYIGSGAFNEAGLDVRLRNASHYQSVFERILGLPVPQPAVLGTEQNVMAAKEIVRLAWTYAINAYSNMMEFANRPELHKRTWYVEQMEMYGELFGLRTGKAVVTKGALFWKSKRVDVTVGDAAGMENRVGRLGLYLGAVEEAADTLPVNQRSTEQILLKVVEMGGAIRASSTPAKTVAMLKVAAMHCHGAKGRFSSSQRKKALKKFLGHQYDAIPRFD